MIKKCKRSLECRVGRIVEPSQPFPSLVDDRDGEVGEMDILILGGSPFFGVTTVEDLHLNTTSNGGLLGPPGDTTDVEDALAVDENFGFAISLSRCVEFETLDDGHPLSGSPVPGTTADRVAIAGVGALGASLLATLVVVLVNARRNVEVQLGFALGTEHKTSGPAAGVVTSTRAGSGNIVVDTSIWN